MDREVEYTEYGVEEDMLSVQTKITDFLKKNLYEIAVVLVCFVRVIVGISDVQLSGKTLIEIVGDSILTIVFAILLARLLEEKGLSVGEQSEKYKSAIKSYRKTEERAGEYIKRLDKWCEWYSSEEYKNTITTMLYPLGISYEQYVKGEYDESRFSKGQLRQLHKVKRLKMYVYTTEELMSGELDRVENHKCLKASKKKYRRRSAVADLGSKVVLAMVFGLLTLPPIAAWNWTGVIWKLFETVVLVAFAVVKYFNAYTFVDEDLTAKVIRKTVILNKFLKDVEEEE